MTTPATPPPQATTTAALDAALRSLHDTGCGCGGEYHPPHDGETARLKAALEAAAPHLAAVERERCAQLAEREEATYRPLDTVPGVNNGQPFKPGPDPLGDPFAALLRQEGGGTPGPHAYLSTACLHGKHSYCQSTTGSNETTQWAKTPASCKFCAAPCTCDCHRAPAQARAAGAGKDVTG